MTSREVVRLCQPEPPETIEPLQSPVQAASGRGFTCGLKASEIFGIMAAKLLKTKDESEQT